MKCDKKTMLLYAVTDRSWTGRQTLYEQVEAALKGGVTCVQLREKDLPEDAFLDEAVKIKTLCHQYHVPFIINDNAPLAVKCGADGVHVGQHDMQAGAVRELIGHDRLLGVSAQTVEQAVLAEKNGADYLGVATGRRYFAFSLPGERPGDRLIGQHAGLTEEEMLVSVLADRM